MTWILARMTSQLVGPRTGVDARGAPESIVTIRYITTRYDPLRPVTIRYDSLRFVTTRYTSLQFVTLRPVTKLLSMLLSY